MTDDKKCQTGEKDFKKLSSRLYLLLITIAFIATIYIIFSSDNSELIKAHSDFLWPVCTLIALITISLIIVELIIGGIDIKSKYVSLTKNSSDTIPEQQELEPRSIKNTIKSNVTSNYEALSPSEKVLYKDLEAKLDALYTDQESKICQLLFELAQSRTYEHFERIYNNIYHSQLNALNSLYHNNSASLKDFYNSYVEGWKVNFGDSKSSSFDEWMGFLVNRELVEVTQWGYGITILGREFINYMGLLI